MKIRVGRQVFYPVLFLRQDRLAARCARITRAMNPREDPWTTIFELVYAFWSLGNKTLPQVMRRNAGYRAVHQYARAVGA
ncbi:hypothetical protein [Caballeronia sp. ATUFL_M2_KS44]|uniref:hypothetical protein n=1 Tax=Caballeronia sp. ATUFL_M2_KS44 TaxID=2921767 RepID=UPI002028D3C2|nr:hypothetical protein [Caballeronia sp. ATUFL_M2_KS44]